MNLRAHARAWLAAARSAVIVEISQARGSVPRGIGTRMLVAADEVLGTIGGGHLELQSIAIARERLGVDAVHEQSIALGPSLGQCCGGALNLRYATLSDAEIARWPEIKPRFVLQLYGAGHVGRAIVNVLAAIPCAVHWIDERDHEFPSAPLPPNVKKICVEPVEAEVDTASPGTFFLVLTHSHVLDQRITEEILNRGDFGFLGLIGSKTKRARFLRRFETRGIDAAVLARLICPIGLRGIQGKEPGVIAVAVAAQLLEASRCDHGAG